MNLDALADLHVFTKLSLLGREVLAAATSRRLSRAFQLDPQQPELDALLFTHLDTGLPFALVPGGTFEMGFTAADLAELKEHLPTEDDLRNATEGTTEELSPAHSVRVSPFLIARDLLGQAEIERIGKGGHEVPNHVAPTRDEACQLVSSIHMRLPSEAELEWLLRDGGRYSFTLDAARKIKEISRDSRLYRSRFGVNDLFDEQWAADDYHPTYEGAPSTSIPWMDGDKAGVFRGGSAPEYVDEPAQLFGVLAAMRAKGTMGQARVRLAMTLSLEELPM